MNKIEMIRDVTTDECGWLTEDIKEGEFLYKFNGHTYGCIGNGVAVTEEKGKEPFFEIPSDSFVFSAE